MALLYFTDGCSASNSRVFNIRDGHRFKFKCILLFIIKHNILSHKLTSSGEIMTKTWGFMTGGVYD